MQLDTPRPGIGRDLSGRLAVPRQLCPIVQRELGGARTALDPPAAPTVRITGLAPNRAASDALMNAKLTPGPRSAAERAEVRERYLTPMLDDLVARTQRAARAGARIVVWAEASAYEFVEDKSAVLERARSVARTERIYLQIGTVWLLPAQRRPFNEIRAIMFDPTGAIVWDYLKTTTPLGDGNVPGGPPTHRVECGVVSPQDQMIQGSVFDEDSRLVPG